uniref:Uncharacterized protein n=1 Tax=Zooxanthella nutricula TaxID=1333877 RepID=A0A7S2QCG1_9DINO
MLDAHALQRWWLQAVLFQDTLVGRDKTMRLVQYTARCLSGLTGSEVWHELLVKLALARKTLRFGRQLRWVKDMRECLLYEKDALNRITTLVEQGSYIIYCCVDHATFAQRIKLLPLAPRRSDVLDRFAEFFWLTECIPAIVREVRAYQTGNGAKEGSQPWLERRAKAKLLLLKLFCDLPCSIYFMQRASWRNRRAHKAWCGFLGVVASAVSIHMNWPRTAALRE